MKPRISTPSSFVRGETESLLRLDVRSRDACLPERRHDALELSAGGLERGTRGASLRLHAEGELRAVGDRVHRAAAGRGDRPRRAVRFLAAGAFGNADAREGEGHCHECRERGDPKRSHDPPTTPWPGSVTVSYGFVVDFRRIPDLPPYVFAAVDELKRELRRSGEDVIDLGFGNPDLPSPPVVVDKLAEAAHIPRNHRYSSSRGIPRLRLAICERYERLWGVRLDPETQAVTTIGAKEGLAHLLWTLVEPGDAALVPSPSYPIHIHAPILAGASVTSVPMGAGEDLFGNLVEAYERSRPRPRVVLLSFPHNPTTATVDLDFMQRVVDLAREREFVVVHDFAYAELGFGERAAVDPPGRRCAKRSRSSSTR